MESNCRLTDFVKWIMADKNVMGIYIKPRPNVKSRGRDEGGISMDKYENQNQGNIKGQYLKLNSHFCSAASHVCPRHLTHVLPPVHADTGVTIPLNSENLSARVGATRTILMTLVCHGLGMDGSRTSVLELVLEPLSS